MPYKYIGRTTDFKGKTLWEILGNLKNFGIGRIITRSKFERYPEPSYIKILKVETLPSPEIVTIDVSTREIKGINQLIECILGCSKSTSLGRKNFSWKDVFHSSHYRVVELQNRLQTNTER